jgi:hypothetical protein
MFWILRANPITLLLTTLVSSCGARVFVFGCDPKSPSPNVILPQDLLVVDLSTDKGCFPLCMQLQYTVLNGEARWEVEESKIFCHSCRTATPICFQKTSPLSKTLGNVVYLFDVPHHRSEDQ